MNIEMKLDNIGEDFQGLDSIEWYGMCEPACRGGGEDVITHENKYDGYSC